MGFLGYSLGVGNTNKRKPKMTDLQTKMERCAVDLLAEIFKAMPKDPTLEELDVELRSAIYALYHVEGKHNAMQPKGTPRTHLRPTGLLLQALTEQYYKSDAGDEEGA